MESSFVLFDGRATRSIATRTEDVFPVEFARFRGNVKLFNNE